MENQLEQLWELFCLVFDESSWPSVKAAIEEAYETPEIACELVAELAHEFGNDPPFEVDDFT